jgi:hypothetical protein
MYFHKIIIFKADQLEIAVIKMAHFLLVRNLGEFTLKIDVFQTVLKIGHDVLKMKDFPGKIDVLVSVLRFLANISNLYWFDNTRPIYNEKNITV